MIFYFGDETPVLTSMAGFEYLAAADGVFLLAENSFFRVLKKYASKTPQMLPGLGELKDKEYMALEKKMPLDMFYELVDSLQESPLKEKMAAVAYDKTSETFSIVVPKQVSNSVSISYSWKDVEVKGRIILEVHSHPEMPAFFSDTDNADNQGFKIYGVFSLLDGYMKDLVFRLGVYGRFLNIEFTDIFEV